VEEKNVLYNLINVENWLKELICFYMIRRKTLRPLVKIQRLSKAIVRLTTDQMFQELIYND
jgi:hypothetical protein